MVWLLRQVVAIVSLPSTWRYPNEYVLGFAEKYFPLADGTQLGMLAFLVQHDSYHVGQMAFLRRQLGRSAMTYRRGAGVAR